MTLAETRRAIRRLLDEQDATDALAVHYAYYYAEDKTQIIAYPADAGPGQATGYVAFSRTGVDLFRPFVTLRLPSEEMEASVDVIYSAMQPGANVILHSPATYFPLLQALFDIHTVTYLQLYALNQERFEPIINVLVTQAAAHNELPRFIIRHNEGESLDVVASAGLNWQTPRFAEVAVNVDPRYQRRGWGRSVLAALVQHLIRHGRTPLYMVSSDNQASIELARTVGFEDRRVRKVMIQATLRPRP